MKHFKLKHLILIAAIVMVMAPVISVGYSNTEYDLYVDRPASEAGTQFYHGAKYEPVTGAYLGMFAEGDSILHNPYSSSADWYLSKVPQVTGKDHAAYMVYVNYSDSDAISNYTSHFREAARLGKAIQVCLQPHNGLNEVQNNQHLIDLALQAKEAGVPIFLRFANEFNDSGNAWYKDGAAKYVEKFRLVANVFRQYAPNVIMVWAPNDFPFETIDKYYPGDAYVDWIGVSSYPIYLENGTPKHKNTWIDRFYQIYEKYGSKKPIFITEGAPSTTVEYKTWTNVTSQAAYEIQRFYAGVARKCPNVKMIIYWSNDETSGRQIHCSLTNNATTLAAYKKAIADSYYLGTFNTSSTKYYQRIATTTMKCQTETISSYVNNWTQRVQAAAYYINGTYVGGGTFPDYSCSINFAAYAGQTITLKADYYNESNKYVASKTVKVKVAAQAPIKIKINGSYVTTDTDPVIVNSRTLVPIRVISESLNAKVSWEASTRTVTVVKGSKTIVLKIDSSNATVNGVNKTLDCPATIMNNRTMVPIRFISEAFDADVDWDSENRTVIINS